MQAYVTIGSGIEPRRAALLDLKTRQGAANITFITDMDNVTSNKGGLLLPRVKLVSISTLEPFIKATNPDFLNNTDNLKEHFAGLMVYNITNTARAVRSTLLFIHGTGRYGLPHILTKLYHPLQGNPKNSSPTRRERGRLRLLNLTLTDWVHGTYQ